MLAAIDEHIGPKRVEVTGEKSGAHLVLWPKRKILEETIVRRAAELEVGVYGMAPYFDYSRWRQAIILGFSRMNETDIREGIRRLAQTGI